MNAPAIVRVAIVAFALPLLGAAEAPVGGITIGSTIAAMIRENGIPTAVETIDMGNRFAYANAVAYANDDGVVVAAETATGTVPIEIEGKPRMFAIGTYTSAQADKDLATVAEFASDNARTYRLSAERELVLTFDKTTHVLARVSYGQRGQLARMGIISGDDTLKAVPYKAPKIRSTALKDGTGTHVTIVKLDVGRAGDVKTVTVVVPSDDPAFDASLTKTLLTDRFIAAQLGGRAIGATYFRELRH
jgi:hypothetical protein